MSEYTDKYSAEEWLNTFLKEALDMYHANNKNKEHNGMDEVLMKFIKAKDSSELDKLRDKYGKENE